MQAVYYFVPSDTILNERDGVLNMSVVEELGLSYALSDRNVIPDQTVFYRDRGPSGQGVILFPKPMGCSDVPSCRYDPDHQHWFDCGKYWIGVEIDGSTDITSEYFRRPSQTTGYNVSDSMGDEWTVPIIRTPDPSRYCLPTEYTIGFKGEFSRKRRDEDEMLWELAGRCRDFISNGGMEEEEVAKAVIKFLGVNYFVSVPEIALLEQLGRKILQSEFVAATISSVADFNLEEDVVQKKSVTTEPTNSLHGQKEDIQDIGQAEAQSVS